MAKAVIIYGPPGAGKGTQANLFAWTKGLIHFDTGKFLDQYLHDPKNADKSGIAEAVKQYESGQLVEPALVLKITREEAMEIAKAGYSVAFSGSPRTMFEAFGDANNKGLITALEESFGKDNITVIFLKIDPKKAIGRNEKRKVCSLCGNAVLYGEETHSHKNCPLCGAPLKKRIVDNPAVFETRIREYEERTKPITEALKARDYKIYEVDADPWPYEIFAELKRDVHI